MIPTKAEVMRDADVLYKLVRDMVLLHHEGNLTQEEHEWAEEQWVIKAIASLGVMAGVIPTSVEEFVAELSSARSQEVTA